MLLHWRYDHVSEQSLKSLADGNLVNYTLSNDLGFCESCIGGKQHQNPLESSETQTRDLLELVHSDVCGKISNKFIGGAQYFLTFTGYKSRSYKEVTTRADKKSSSLLWKQRWHRWEKTIFGTWWGCPKAKGQLGANRFIRRKPDQMDLCKGTKQG